MRSSTFSGSTTSGLWRENSAARALTMARRVSRSGLSSAMQSPPARRDLTSAPSPSSACGRAVGGDHHPAAQIGKGVDGVEELRRRGGGAADMLQIVDDQHFGGAQLFLEGQRVLAIERAQEMAHEILGPQEQGALAALAEFQRRGVEQMGLAEAEAAMDVEQRNVAVLAFGEGARRAMAEFIGGPGMKLSKVCCGCSMRVHRPLAPSSSRRRAAADRKCWPARAAAARAPRRPPPALRRRHHDADGRRARRLRRGRRARCAAT